MWRPPDCGDPCAAFSSGAVGDPTLECQHIKGDETCGGPLIVEAGAHS